jgi:hypothetical protein
MFAKRFFYVCAGLLCLAITYHLGARNATAKPPVVPEVVVRTGTVRDGEFIPLPTYKDGTTALESECRWIVSAGHINMTGVNPVFTCETLAHTGGIEMYSLEPNAPSDPSRANYLIIAVRGG